MNLHGLAILRLGMGGNEILLVGHGSGKRLEGRRLDSLGNPFKYNRDRRRDIMGDMS